MARQMAAEINAQLEVGAPSALGFEPISIPDLRQRWLDHHEHVRRSSLETIRRYRAATEHSDIPETFKPFQPETIGYWLDNPIYYGELRWERNATGIIDDMRVVRRNAVEDMLRVAEFCPPIVDRETWEQVQAVRQVRRDRIAVLRRRKADANGKQIQPPAPGLSVKYLLSGLVFCSECGLRMTGSSTSAYVAESGEVRRYTSYVCSGYLSGQCANSKRVPEQWLREVVIARIRARLFPWSE